MACSKRMVLGTMRMHETGNTPSALAKFLVAIHERGVRSLHSSFEYDSFPLLCETLKELNRNSSSCKFRHVVKLAEPTFNESGFNATRLQDRLERYRD